MTEPTSEAAEQIYAWIDEHLGRKTVGTANRASSAPGCVLKRWRQNQGQVGEPLTPRAISNFALGDVAEHVVKYLISQACVGPGKLYSEVDFGEAQGEFTIQSRTMVSYAQKTVFTQIPDPSFGVIKHSDGRETYAGYLTIPGHVDWWGKRNSDGQWELGDSKSASDFAFDGFVDGSKDNDYERQMHTLLRSDRGIELKAKSYRLFYVRKQTGHLFDRRYEFDPKVWARVKQEFVTANQPLQPAKPFSPVEETYYKKPTGRWVLPWQCSYCEYRGACWPEFKVEYKSGRPKWVYEKKSEVAGAGEKRTV